MPRPSRPWFRFYVEAFADRKLRRLKPETRWLFAACIGLARQSSDPGRLLIGDEPAEVDDLADFAALTPAQVRRGVADLLDGGLLTRDDDGVLAVPAFRHRQFESDNVTERTRKHRSKERSNDVPGNAPDTEADTDTEAAAQEVEIPGPAVTAEQRRQRIMEAARQVAEERAIGRNDIGPGWVPAAANGIAQDHHQELHAYLVANPEASTLELIENVIDVKGRTPAKTGGVTVDGDGLMVPGSGRVAYFRLEDQWRTNGEAGHAG